MGGTLACEQPWSASGSNSANTIHTMHPAANPSAMGSSARKALTNIKAGTATSACGRLVRTALHTAPHPLQSMVFTTRTHPRHTSLPRSPSHLHAVP